MPRPAAVPLRSNLVTGRLGPAIDPLGRPRRCAVKARPAAVPDVSAGNPSDILWVVSTTRRSALAVVAALFAGLVVGVLILPSAGVDTYPSVCWAWGGYEVPCDSGPSYFFVFAAAGITAIGTWYLTRPRSHA